MLHRNGVFFDASVWDAFPLVLLFVTASLMVSTGALGGVRPTRYPPAAEARRDLRLKTPPARRHGRRV